MAAKELVLGMNWEVKSRSANLTLPHDFSSPDEWLSATVPGVVQQDLLAAGRIPDPFIGLHEQDVQWVGEQDWLYRCTFQLSDDWEQMPCIDLCFDGLDTFATVWLNGVQVLVSDNMFLAHRVDVRSLLAQENTLWLLFDSAVRRGREREAQYGVRTIWGDGDTSRVYVRKAQYHYGWDWGPIIMTAGPWRPIYLQGYTTRIADLACPYEISADLQYATLTVNATLEQSNSLSSQKQFIRVALYTSDSRLFEEVTLPVDGIEVQHTFTLSSPDLWWPSGYGQQHLYRVVAILLVGTQQLDRREMRTGIRRLRLLQHSFADQPGAAFCFEVNNTRIFCGGANWIPADSLLPRVTPERYRQELHYAADANMKMVRVWGGGVYEEDSFYDMCDELGLLVWQDFMFACGIYPALDWFQASVRAESETAVRRLRHHPSIALWCGNNEDYMHSSTFGLYDPDAVQEEIITGLFPSRVVYEQLLPDVCAELDPERPYWRGSPYGGRNANDVHVGDHHMWNVWHGPMLPYQEYATVGGRFVSEFGMQAFPALKTIESFTTSEERYVQSRTIEHHNKASDGPRRLAVYVSDTLRTPSELEEYIYATQFVQAEAIGAGLRGWRRRWQGEGREYTAGALVWQLNDCWPVTSWALIDSALRPKAAYYVARRELAALSVGLARNSPTSVEVWATNGTLATVNAKLHVTMWTLDGKHMGEVQRSYVLPPNRSIELGEIPCQESASWVLGASLQEEDGLVAYTTCWPEPFKYLTLPNPHITLVRMGDDILKLVAERPAKGVWLEASDSVKWSDNMLDLLPGQPRVIQASGLGDNAVIMRWLGLAVLSKEGA